MYIPGNGSTINEFLLVIRQKTESKYGGNKKTKHGNFLKNKHDLPPHVCFSKNLSWFAFLLQLYTDKVFILGIYLV